MLRALRFPIRCLVGLVMAAVWVWSFAQAPAANDGAPGQFENHVPVTAPVLAHNVPTLRAVDGVSGRHAPSFRPLPTAALSASSAQLHLGARRLSARVNGLDASRHRTAPHDATAPPLA